MKTIQELNQMTVTEIQEEMAIANRNFDGDYQTIVENIMVEKEMEMINAKTNLIKKSRKELEEMALASAKNLRSEHKGWTVDGRFVLGQLSQATVSKSWLKVWKKEHLVEIIKVLN